MTGPLRACLFGVPGANRNLGVGALRAATLGGLLARQPDARITVFDDGWGERLGRAYVAGRPVPIRLAGARLSRRLHRPESYLNMRVSAALGGLRNGGLAAIDAAHVVLDVSGGDSFSDIYGERRFRTVAWPKRLTLLRGRPLVLLPQTYGPFASPRLRAEAAALVRGAAMAWARDPESFVALADLLGDDLDPARHRCGVDVAFALEPREPDGRVYEPLAGWLTATRGPLIGLNVSGLLARPESRVRFRLAADCVEAALGLAERLLGEPDTRLLLVPHVRTPGAADDDAAVSERLHARLAGRHGDRVRLMPPDLDPHQAKWVIARTDFFCSMRMHAAIAALSSGVPTALIAYSDKAAGVFTTVGQRGNVADARRHRTADLLDLLWEAWSRRSAVAVELAGQVPGVIAQAGEQMDAIVALARAVRPRRPRRTRAGAS